MRKTPILALLLAGCGTGQPANDSAPQASPPAQTDTMFGLYEGGGARRNQLCIVERDDGAARFGLVAWNGAAPGCSGAGTAAYASGTIVALEMDGDEPCMIEARLDGRRLTFPPGLPRGCSYYCAPGARLAGLDFVKTGGTDVDAMRARDLVGDPLCPD